MSTYLHYCEVCGQILDHDDIYQKLYPEEYAAELVRDAK